MQLINKYLYGFGTLAIAWIIFFFEGTVTNIKSIMLMFVIFPDLSSSEISSLMTTFLSPEILLIIGVSTFGISVILFLLLFSPERIKGDSMDFEASPDLSTFRIIQRKETKDSIKAEKIPETAFCSACGQKIYKPFHCKKCNQLLCGKHYLPGDHICREV